MMQPAVKAKKTWFPGPSSQVQTPEWSWLNAAGAVRREGPRSDGTGPRVVLCLVPKGTARSFITRWLQESGSRAASCLWVTCTSAHLAHTVC